MVPMTILVDEAPKCVVRPNDMKALLRFLRNGKAWLLADDARRRAGLPRGRRKGTTRSGATPIDLHRAWGGDEDDFFGVPL